LRGKTSVRELFRLIHKSEGVLTCVSFPMHIAAALSKPCVVVAGAREGTRWELYPNHQFIYLNGTLPCAPYDGCWRSQHKDCINMTEGGIPKCMAIITPKMVADRIKIYYEGGVLTK
jgi:ADP-heptose:LPS heptosyltransferase